MARESLRMVNTTSFKEFSCLHILILIASANSVSPKVLQFNSKMIVGETLRLIVFQAVFWIPASVCPNPSVKLGSHKNNRCKIRVLAICENFESKGSVN